MAEVQIDPFVSTEPEVELDDETRRILRERVKLADSGQLLSAESTGAYSAVAFKLLYLEDSLIDLESVFSWSREQQPGSTEQFAIDLFNHLGYSGPSPTLAL